MSRRTSRKQLGSGSHAGPTAKVEPPDLTLKDLEPLYAHVLRLRESHPRRCSPEEKKFRKHLGKYIGYLEQQHLSTRGRGRPSQELRQARNMLYRLIGIEGMHRPSKGNKKLLKDWDETRDYGKPAARKALPNGGVRIVRGGAPGLGRRA